ncbi:MAG: 50S ribosomal protein L23 [Parcubacteria group bacterium]|nr:50S ribosomal protein L23 [Parcubacteria group bacterium]
MSHIIKRLHVTEKAADAEARSVYTFVVDNKATKNEIAKEIKQTYNVTPESVRVMNMRGKRVRWGRNTGQRSGWKKAMVCLKKGDKINLHEGT